MRRANTMNSTKAALSAVAAIIIAWCVNAWPMFSRTKATGLAGIIGSFLGSPSSPVFWIVAFLAFGLFFSASRLGNKALRVVFFWVPTLAVSGLSATIALLIVCLLVSLHFRL